MQEQTYQKAMGDAKNELKIDLPDDIPMACQYGNLCSNDRIHNENVNWLTERNKKLPIWSRLNVANCVGHPRRMMLSNNKDYEIEIPGRLLSIFGNINQQTKLINKMQDMENQQLVTNVLALCCALNYNFREWCANLLDQIIAKSSQLYPELLKKLNITDREMTICNLSQLYQFDDVNYQVQLPQVATGYVYIRYGLNEFNLARALTWFFRHYQFGLLQSGKRTLAFGFTPDTDFSYFMYDCQSRGQPLFANQQANSYILRTHHLQILLYCLIITLNVTKEMTKFHIYNVDIRIINPLETKTLKKEIYVPTIAGLPKKEVKKKIDCGTIHKKANNKSNSNTSSKNSKPANTLKLTTKDNLKFLNFKSKTDSKAKTLESENLKIQNSHNDIPLDPNKSYYIIAVPKQSNISITKSESKQTYCSKDENHKRAEKLEKESHEYVKVNIHSINSPVKSSRGKDSETEITDLNETASTDTLTPNTEDVSATNNSNNLDLKVKLVDNFNNSATLK